MSRPPARGKPKKGEAATVEARIAILDRIIADIDHYLNTLRQDRIDLKLRLQDPAPAPVRAAVPRDDQGQSRSEASSTPRASLPERTAAKAELMRHLYASLSPEDRAVRDAGMLAKNIAFQDWLTETHHGTKMFDGNAAADWIRDCCGVESRSEFAVNAAARERFLELKARFEKESGRLAEVRG